CSQATVARLPAATRIDHSVLSSEAASDNSVWTGWLPGLPCAAWLAAVSIRWRLVVTGLLALLLPTAASATAGRAACNAQELSPSSATLRSAVVRVWLAVPVASVAYMTELASVLCPSRPLIFASFDHDSTIKSTGGH